MTSSYPALGSLGVIGDGRSLALLDETGGVQWYCPLRFDADPVVWPLLDHRRGGRLRIGPVATANASLSYLPDSAVLRYQWETSDGSADVTVGFLWPPETNQDLVWLVQGRRGHVEFEVLADLRPRFGRHEELLRPVEGGVELVIEDLRLTLCGAAAFDRAGAGYRHAVTVGAGERLAFRLHAGPVGDTVPVTSPETIAAGLAATMDAWESWVGGIRYDGAYRPEVVRSAITLKLLIYEPSGAVVAAGTTSLPEDIGGVRNWDYRYTWLRDASFTLNALYQLGCWREAHRYGEWMCATTGRHGLPLRVLYGIDGGTDLAESELNGLEGYRGSRPVRVGNGAEHQLQLDSYGELLDCVSICEVLGDEVMRREWPHFRALVDFVAEHWRDPDSGIWEVRDKLHHFVHSKAMAWVALDRGCRLVESLNLPGDLAGWRAEADELRAQILSDGVLDGSFTRAYGDDQLDASLLMLPIVGFVDGADPVMARTLDAIAERLTPDASGPLLYRYRFEAGDGLPGEEGAFTICSFWLVEALALAGRSDEAHEAFTALTKLAGNLGLYAEEIDPATGEQLGNVPQAFTHIGLINAALRLAGVTTKGTGPTLADRRERTS